MILAANADLALPASVDLADGADPLIDTVTPTVANVIHPHD